MQKELKVQTSQNVQISFELGAVGMRLLAALLDLLAMGLYLYLIQFILSALFSIQIFGDSINIWITLLVILPLFLYFPILEYFWSGRTVGKRLLKLRVVRSDGSAPSLGDIVLRWLVRIVDVKLGFLMIFFVPRMPSSAAEETFMIWTAVLLLLPLPIVGIISMATSPLNQRLGDRIADTVVVRKTKLFDLSETILQSTSEEYSPVYNNVLILSDRDIYIIKEALEKLDTTNDYKYILRLANKAREILDIKDRRKPIEVLQTIMKDYDYLAKKKDSIRI